MVETLQLGGEPDEDGRRDLSNVNVRTAFNVARPMHIPQVMEDHNIHGRLIGAFPREVAGLEGQAVLECRENKDAFAKGTSKLAQQTIPARAVGRSAYANAALCPK